MCTFFSSPKGSGSASERRKHFRRSPAGRRGGPNLDSCNFLPALCRGAALAAGPRGGPARGKVKWGFRTPSLLSTKMINPTPGFINPAGVGCIILAALPAPRGLSSNYVWGRLPPPHIVRAQVRGRGQRRQNDKSHPGGIYKSRGGIYHFGAK